MQSQMSVCECVCVSAKWMHMEYAIKWRSQRLRSAKTSSSTLLLLFPLTTLTTLTTLIHIHIHNSLA